MVRERNETVAAAARGVAVVAGSFAAVVLILLVATFVQLKTVAPLDSPAIETLEQRLTDNPDDEQLREQIRALDLLARKAFFTSQWQLRVGGYLLLGAILVLLIALRLLGLPRRRLPQLEKRPEPYRGWIAATRARTWIAAGGVAVFVLCLGVALLSQSQLGQDHNLEAGKQAPKEPPIGSSWPAFRGPGSNGVAQTEEAPVDWDGSTGRGILWRAEVPLQGYSSPVVWGDWVFVTGADAKVQEVYCYHASTGELLWRRQVKDVPGRSPDKPRIHVDTGYAPSTVTTDGRSLFAIFPTGDLAALDLEGNPKWATNLGLPDNLFGHASSLLIFDNKLIVQYDQKTNGRLLAVDTATGDTVWRATRSALSWSSPICVNTGERMELILTNGTSVDSYDPRTGVKLWSLDCLDGDMGPSAAYADGMVFAANDYASVVGIRLAAPTPEVVWTYEEELPDTASPVAAAGLVLIATSYGVIVCFDAATGEVQWLEEFDDGFYASPIIVGDTVYAMDLGGTTHIFKLANTYQSVAEPQIGEQSASTPAVVENRIYLRGDRFLYCVAETS